METQIDAGRVTADVGRVNIEKMRSDMRWENRKFVVQAIVALAAAAGAGAAVGNYAANRTPTPPQVIYIVPGQAPPAITPTPAR